MSRQLCNFFDGANGVIGWVWLSWVTGLGHGLRRTCLAISSIARASGILGFHFAFLISFRVLSLLFVVFMYYGNHSGSGKTKQGQ